MRSIAVRADADIRCGTGDLVSLINLSSYFIRWKRFVITRDTPEARKILKGRGLSEAVYLPAGITRAEEVVFINKVIKAKGIDAFFLEITNGAVTPYRKIVAPFKGCIDFFGDTPAGFDMVINWDITDRGLYSRGDTSRTRYLLGPEYTLIAKSILRGSRSLAPKPRTRGKKILVFFGGFDRFDFTLRAIGHLDHIQGEDQIRVILGAGYRREERLRERIKRSRKHTSIYKNVSDMGPHYRWADFFVGAGGLSLFEAVASALPSVIVATCEHQIKRSIFFDRAKAISYMGYRSLERDALENALASVHYKTFKKSFLVGEIPGIVHEVLDRKR